MLTVTRARWRKKMAGPCESRGNHHGLTNPWRDRELQVHAPQHQTPVLDHDQPAVTFQIRELA